MYLRFIRTGYKWYISYNGKTVGYVDKPLKELQIVEWINMTVAEHIMVGAKIIFNESYTKSFQIKVAN